MKYLYVAIFSSIFTLAACGSDDTVNQDVRPVENQANNEQVYIGSGWTTETDPLTGNSYRCLTVWINRGLGLYCYSYTPE